MTRLEFEILSKINFLTPALEILNIKNMEILTWHIKLIRLSFIPTNWICESIFQKINQT